MCCSNAGGGADWSAVGLLHRDVSFLLSIPRRHEKTTREKGPSADGTLYSLFLFLLFFPRATLLAPPAKPTTAATSSPKQTESQQPSFRTAIAVFILCIFHAFAILFLSILITSLHPKAVPFWAYFLGVFGTVLAAIQFLPQIYTTWRLQAVGSLSIPMMCIQTPGSFVWVGSLSARLGWQGWSTWGIYAVTGVLQGSLLVMGVTFEMRERRRRIEEGVLEGNGHAPEGERDDERTGLIGNER